MNNVGRNNILIWDEPFNIDNVEVIHKLSCENCKKSFYSAADLRKHKDTCNKTCNICGVLFARVAEVKRHIAESHTVRSQEAVPVVDLVSDEEADSENPDFNVVSVESEERPRSPSRSPSRTRSPSPLDSRSASRSRSRSRSVSRSRSRSTTWDRSRSRSRSWSSWSTSSQSGTDIEGEKDSNTGNINISTQRRLKKVSVNRRVPVTEGRTGFEMQIVIDNDVNNDNLNLYQISVDRGEAPSRS